MTKENISDESETVPTSFELLTAAVEKLMEEVGLDNSVLLTEYCIVAMHQWYDDEGRMQSQPIVISRDGEVPAYRIKGMLVEALDDMRSSEAGTVIIVSGDGFDDEETGDYDGPEDE